MAVVVSRDFLPDPSACREQLTQSFGDAVRLSDTLGAVSLIGAGINQTFENLRRCLSVLEAAGIEALGVHTSSFRITALISSAKVQQAARLLHAEFISAKNRRPTRPPQSVPS